VVKAADLHHLYLEGHPAIITPMWYLLVPISVIGGSTNWHTGANWWHPAIIGPM